MHEAGVGIHLARGYKVLEGMDGQAEDVIIVAHVEPLGILLSVVHDPDGSHVVDYLPGLGVEQVAPAVVASVAANQTWPWFSPREIIRGEKRTKRLGFRRASLWPYP